MEDFVNAEVFAELATLKFTTDREPDDKEGDSGNNLLPRGGRGEMTLHGDNAPFKNIRTPTSRVTSALTSLFPPSAARKLPRGYFDGRCTTISSPISMLIRSSPTSSGPE